jgi:two-component system, NtrC family, sensor kinase
MAAVAETLVPNHRILVVDDNEDIHSDFRRILAPRRDVSELDALEQMLTGAPAIPVTNAVVDINFTIDSAFQGGEALQLVRRAEAERSPYALAFVDVRMPPGWDGIETVSRIWAEVPELEIVLCSAYSDYSWHDILMRLGRRDGLVILKKPFETIEVAQLAHALTEKWFLKRRWEQRVDDLERAVRERTSSLEKANVQLRSQMAELERMVAERERIDRELERALKLEAVGRLAAGVAHEINTPTQYIGSAVEFLETAIPQVERGMRALVAFHALAAPCLPGNTAVSAVRDTLAEVDLDYLMGEMPAAVGDARTGVERVSEIVRSMRELAYPGRIVKEKMDLNRPLKAAIELARNEYKYCADIEIDLGDIPIVECDATEMGQVFLNLIVNAAHAMQAVHASTGRRGRLNVRSHVDGDELVVDIADTGGGIPESIRDRIFEPFFTTKPFSQGTGQGLAIARRIVVEKHAGALTLETEMGAGSVFHVRIPIVGRVAEARAAS